MPKTETADGGEVDPAKEQVARGDAQGTAAGPADGGTRENASRWRLSNWQLRYKLAAVLLVPLIAALVFGSLRAARALGDASEFTDTVAQVEVSERVAEVVHELQRERTITVTGMANASDVGQKAVEKQNAVVDTAVDRLRDFVAEQELNDSTRYEFESVLQRLEALDPLRDKIKSSPFPALSAYITYNSIIDPLIQVGRTVNLSVTDRELLRQGTTVQAVAEAKEYTSRQNAVLQIAIGHNSFIADIRDRSRSAQAGARAAVDTFDSNATLSEQQLYADSVSGAEVDNRERLIATAYATATRTGGGINTDSARLSADGRVTTDKMRHVERQLLTKLRKSAGEFASDASRAAWLFFGLLVATLVITVLLTLMVARALTRPLRTLRSSALEVAYVRLPETVRRILADPNPMEASRDAVAPVPVHTREEIGEVARSFDVVHERAIRLAAEQALLRENVNGIFVNLSRRSQRLVERQLGIIDRLESDEQDPDQLASLFELDHLATRLRRNGESLLVLSGAGLTKSMSKPVPAADVIGASVSEIEQYARVELGTIPEVSVHGRAVHDLVHLLAELLDNATYFSEPETKISVRAVVTRRDSLAVQITDRGVGMSEQQLTEANDRLADPPDLDVSVTRRMGLYVVARLAKRQGIEVRLRENEDIEGGVIARVVVPAELLALQNANTTGMISSNGAGASAPATPEIENSVPTTSSAGASAPTASVPPLPAPRGSVSEDRTPLPPSPSPRPSVWQDATDQAEPPNRADPLNRTESPNRVEPGKSKESGPPPSSVNGHGGYAWPEDPVPAPESENGSQQASRSEQAAYQVGSASTPPARGEVDENGLRSLDEPISLDDLVGGVSKAAGPFVTPNVGSAADPTTELLSPVNSVWPDSEEPQWPVESPDGDTDGPGGASSTLGGLAALPKRGAHSLAASSPQSESTSVAEGGSALEDDVPTRRLPIYQSVLSRWFSEETSLDQGAGDDAEPPEAVSGAVGDIPAGDGVALPQTNGADGVDGADRADGVETVKAGMTPDFGDDTTGSGAAGSPAASTREWSSVADTGWEAAHSLLEDKNEETTSAGLPKRVPNAYLVPGSAGLAENGGGNGRGDEFTDTTVGEPGQGAIAKSAEAARNRMKSFQRGYTSGRHALNEPSTHSEQFDETGTNPRSNGLKE